MNEGRKEDTSIFVLKPWGNKQARRNFLSNVLSAMTRNMQKLEQDVSMAPEPCFGGQRGQPGGNNCRLKEEPVARKSYVLSRSFRMAETDSKA